MTYINDFGSQNKLSDAPRLFLDAMRAHDLLLSQGKQLETDGQRHYCDVDKGNGRRGKGAGRYCYYPDGVIPAGWFKNWTNGGKSHSWHYKGGSYTKTERQEINRKAAQAREQRTESESDYTKLKKVSAILRTASYAPRSKQWAKRTFRPVAYFNGRGIDIVPKCAELLSATDANRLTGTGFPAVVMPIVGPKGVLQGVHLTYLTTSRRKNLPKGKKNKRRVHGHEMGGYIPLARPRDDKPLIVGEGVESTLSAMQITGLPGISVISAVNMPKIDVPRCSEVIIAADNDEVGLKAARELALRLANQGRRVRIASPENEGEDWNDVIREGDDVRQLREQLLRAKLVKREKRILPMSLDQFMNLKVPQCEYLLEPWLTTGSLTMIHARRGAAKTWLGLSIAHAVSSGRDLLGWTCKKQTQVLYVDGELPVELLQDRFRMLGDRPPTGNLQILSAEMFEAQDRAMPDLGTEEGRKILDEMIDEQQPELIILDSLSTLVRSGVENEAESWVPIQAWLMKHRRNRRSIILIHHEGKSGSPRGSSKREDVLDTVIRLKQREQKAGDDDILETILDLEFTKRRRFHGRDAAPMVLKLITASDFVEWEAQTARDDALDRVRALLKQGLKQNLIAKELGVTEARVSQIVKRLKEVKT